MKIISKDIMEQENNITNKLITLFKQLNCKYDPKEFCRHLVTFNTETNSLVLEIVLIDENYIYEFSINDNEINNPDLIIEKIELFRKEELPAILKERESN